MVDAHSGTQTLRRRTHPKKRGVAKMVDEDSEAIVAVIVAVELL